MKKAGREDLAIAQRIPKMMYDLDLTEIDVRFNDKIDFMLPDCSTEEQRKSYGSRLNQMLAHQKTFAELTYESLVERGQESVEYFLLGGGTKAEIEDYRKFLLANKEGIAKIYEHEISKLKNKEGWFTAIRGLYVSKGRKK